ncbi:MAG: hypothetical protein AB7G75_33255 [Candidatus Binatia bacterium]
MRLREKIDRFLVKFGATVVLLCVLLWFFSFFPSAFEGNLQVGANAQECLPGGSENWVPIVGLSCLSRRPPTLTGAYEEDFVSYQVSQGSIDEHIALWRHFAGESGGSEDCRKMLTSTSFPQSWPTETQLKVVTALPPDMDKGCVWVARQTGRFYITVRWGR